MAIIEKKIKLVDFSGENELIGLFDSGATYLQESRLVRNKPSCCLPPDDLSRGARGQAKRINYTQGGIAK